MGFFHLAATYDAVRRWLYVWETPLHEQAKAGKVGQG